MSNARELAELGGSYGTGGFVGMKNRIINGAMMIDQRNAGASVTPANNQYLVDRFVYYSSQASKFTAQQNAGSVTPPAGFVNYLGFTSSSSYSVGASDYFSCTHIVEGLNVADLNWGTTNAATVTLSFWVRSSLTGTFGGSLANSGGSRSYPFTYTISAANTWEQKSITIAGDTSGTWLKTNGAGISLYLGLGVGSTYSGTAGSWAGSLYLSVTGATSVVGTSGATFYITGVQLEKGTQATSFDFRSYGTEFFLCQRYYEVLVYDSEFNPLSINGNNICGAARVYQAKKRANPTMSTNMTNANYGTTWWLSVPQSTTITKTSGTVILNLNGNDSGCGIVMYGATWSTPPICLRTGASGTPYVYADAEL